MLVINLLSSSSGNCTIIKSGDTEIMIDAGASFKQIGIKYEEAMEKKFEKLDAIFISHEHGKNILPPIREI